MLVSRPPITANIDIDPWSVDNPVAPDSDDGIHVVVFSSSTANGEAVDLDTSKIDPTTLRLGRGGARNQSIPWPMDQNSDYNTDATFTFATPDANVRCEDTELTLTGVTYSGVAFTGTDTITTEDCGGASCHP